MLENTTRDVALVPALRPAMEAVDNWMQRAGDTIVVSRRERGARRRRVRAAVGHAMSFETWRSLVRDQRLSAAEAIELMTSLVAAAARG